MWRFALYFRFESQFFFHLFFSQLIFPLFESLALEASHSNTRALVVLFSRGFIVNLRVESKFPFPRTLNLTTPLVYLLLLLPIPYLHIVNALFNLSLRYSRFLLHIIDYKIHLLLVFLLFLLLEHLQISLLYDLIRPQVQWLCSSPTAHNHPPRFLIDFRYLLKRFNFVSYHRLLVQVLPPMCEELPFIVQVIYPSASTPILTRGFAVLIISSSSSS